MQQLNYLFNCWGGIDRSVFRHGWKTVWKKKNMHTMMTGLLKLQVEVLNTISLFLFWQFFFFFISLVGRLRNQIGRIILLKDQISKIRGYQQCKKREAHHARQTSRIKQGKDQIEENVPQFILSILSILSVPLSYGV